MNKKEKISLKAIDKKYLSIIRDWRNTDLIWKYNTQFTLLNMTNQKNWFKKIQDKNSDKKMFMIIYENKPIGVCGLINFNNDDKQADIAIIIGNTKFHGMGLGSKVLRKLLEIGFFKFRLHKINAEVFEFNKPSFGLFKKLGFSQDAIEHQSLWRNKQWWNVHIFSILIDDFKINSN
jgi:UDP-4-amino-4,6-dideoxy-N-acetyl-beta-L-altrosamine N-acetyltransferase